MSDPVFLMPNSTKLLRFVVSEGIANEESVRVAFGLRKWEGLGVVNALKHLKMIGLLECDVYGNYLPTEAGRLRATQKNPVRKRKARRQGYV